jgi:hypothetical protein
MTESNQLAEDLQFVRNAVEARDKRVQPATMHLLIWAAYSLICIPMYDFIPAYAGRINTAGWLSAMVASFILGKREARQTGQFDRAMMLRSSLHWYGGIALLLMTVFGLAWFGRGISGDMVGQVSVILVGFLYYTAGVHLADVKFMRVAGPIIIAAGIGMGAIPHYRWTVMGLIFAVCLLSPLVFAKRVSQQP